MSEELEAHILEQFGRAQVSFWHRLRWKAVSFHLPRRRSLELLDIGAGSGFVGDLLYEERPGSRYLFLEAIPTAECLLEERFGPGSNARSVVEKKADVVTMLDVLEHQEDDLDFLREALRRCRPGGLVILTVPAFQGLWSAWDVALGHFRRYRKPDLLSLAARLPVDIVELSYLFPELLLPAWVRKKRRSRSSFGPAGAAEFPTLPRAVDALLYGIGRISLASRRAAPAGTSLFCVMRLREG